MGCRRDPARRYLAVSRHRLRRRAGGQHAGALAGPAPETRGGKFPGRVRAELSVRSAGRPGALVWPGGGRPRRPRVRPGNRHRAGRPAAQPFARGGAGAGRAPVESQPGTERARGRGVVRAGRCAPPRTGTPEGAARLAGAAGRIPGEAAQDAPSAARAGRATGGTRRGDARRWHAGSGRAAAWFCRAPARCRRTRQRRGARRPDGRAAAVSTRRPALVERAGRGGRRRRAGRRHGSGQDAAADHPSAVAQAGRRADPAGADRGADQPDPELAIGDRTLCADAAGADPARSATRRGICPARCAGHRADQLRAAAARRGHLAKAAIRTDRAG